MLKSVFRDPDNVSNNSTYMSNSILRTLDIYKINLKLQHICQIILPDNVYCKMYDFITQNHQNLEPSDIICVERKKWGDKQRGSVRENAETYLLLSAIGCGEENMTAVSLSASVCVPNIITFQIMQ